jgi:hypothetical protein
VGDLVDEGIDIAITFGGLEDTSHIASLSSKNQ